MTREEALAIYQAGPETVVSVLLEMEVHLDAGTPPINSSRQPKSCFVPGTKAPKNTRP